MVGGCVLKWLVGSLPCLLAGPHCVTSLPCLPSSLPAAALPPPPPCRRRAGAAAEPPAARCARHGKLPAAHEAAGKCRCRCRRRLQGRLTYPPWAPGLLALSLACSLPLSLVPRPLPPTRPTLLPSPCHLTCCCCCCRPAGAHRQAQGARAAPPGGGTAGADHPGGGAQPRRRRSCGAVPLPQAPKGGWVGWGGWVPSTWPCCAGLYDLLPNAAAALWRRTMPCTEISPLPCSASP